VHDQETWFQAVVKLEVVVQAELKCSWPTCSQKTPSRGLGVPKSLAAIFKEYLAGKQPGTLLFSSRNGRRLLQRNINRDWLHPILESVGLRTAQR